jgi:uncharacterized protein YlzI (FlbEa/FlbD family)
MTEFVNLTRRVLISNGTSKREVELPMLVNPAHIVTVKKMGQGHVELMDINGNTHVVHDTFERVVEAVLGMAL